MEIDKNIKISIIISVYKNIKALDIILKALENQTLKVDEIIISEDGNFDKMKEFIDSLKQDNIIHLSCEDIGWRKNIALNKAIVKASGDYLIFIDGDVVPHKDFIKGHISLSEKNKVCCGKRSELGQKYSELIYDKKMQIDQISDNYLKLIIPLHKDKVHHYEDGIYSKFLNKITSNRYVRHIIGCNFSCYKEDILKINGFNEDYIHPAEGEDVDITWRFRGLGIEMKSCRYVANVYHLWHKKGFGEKEGSINRNIMDQNIKNKQYICLNGIKKLKKEDMV